MKNNKAELDLVALNLKAGDLVRIRTHKEILDTLDTNNKNRGMYFDAEEVPYCGQTFRVRSTVSNRRTGPVAVSTTSPAASRSPSARTRMTSAPARSSTNAATSIPATTPT